MYCLVLHFVNAGCNARWAWTWCVLWADGFFNWGCREHGMSYAFSIRSSKHGYVPVCRVLRSTISRNCIHHRNKYNSLIVDSFPNSNLLHFEISSLCEVLKLFYTSTDSKTDRQTVLFVENDARKDSKSMVLSQKPWFDWLFFPCHQGASNLVFCIGGPYGHGRQLQERANLSIKLSSLVFNHEIALVVLVEQLYR